MPFQKLAVLAVFYVEFAIFYPLATPLQPLRKMRFLTGKTTIAKTKGTQRDTKQVRDESATRSNPVGD